MIYHPHTDSENNKVAILRPDIPSSPHLWHDSTQAVCFTPGCVVPNHLNNIPIKSIKPNWDNHTVKDIDSHIPFHNSLGFHTAAGIVIVEPDHRVWLTTPSNHYGGYKFTFPKGSRNDREHLRHTAVRETHEETGLLAEPLAYLGDYKRHTSVSRMYVGRRVSGSPADQGWESQAIHLIPLEHLHNYVHTPVDQTIVYDLKKHLGKT